MDEPEDYLPPTPPPTQQIYSLRSGAIITLHLVGASPTEAHHLWNGAKIITEYFEDDPSRVKNKNVLELGAAAGLPSLVAGIMGARKVVMTDFPDPDLVANMQRNIDEECDKGQWCEGQELLLGQRIDAMGFVWGGDPEPLLARLNSTHDDRDGGAASTSSSSRQRQQQKQQQQTTKFDVLILADLLFRHNEHGSLVKTIKETMARSPASVAFVFFTSYRPWKQDKDMAFFDVARTSGFEVAQVVERKLDRPLFEDDPGDLDVQKTVKGFEIRWPAESMCGL